MLLSWKMVAVTGLEAGQCYSKDTLVCLDTHGSWSLVVVKKMGPFSTGVAVMRVPTKTFH